MDERSGEAYEGGLQVTVVGRKLRAGDTAPDFSLDHLNPADGQIRTVHLADTAGKVRLLNVINSIDTPVCHVETRHWESLRSVMPPNVQIYTVSMDLPYAQARWHAAEEISHPSLSAHRDEAFGRDYGVLVKEWRLLQRAVFVIDREDRIAYAEYVADQMQEPNYEVALANASKAAS
ncbi:MAG: Redoxin domain protein [Chloroflexi bacterium]|nr:Redoxin domain protein [Chloroflexota bacterium]